MVRARPFDMIGNCRSCGKAAGSTFSAPGFFRIGALFVRSAVARDSGVGFVPRVGTCRFVRSASFRPVVCSFVTTSCQCRCPAISAPAAGVRAGIAAGGGG